jgi:hypothetical protein
VSVRLCRFNDNRLGLVEEHHSRHHCRPRRAPGGAIRFPHDVFIAHLDEVATRAKALAPSAPVLALDGVTLLSPVANPGKLVAAPVNYEKHLAEVKSDASLHQNTASHTMTIHKAGVFLKATSSLVGPGEGVALRVPDRRTDHEVELAFVIGRTASRVPRTEALPTSPATPSASTSRFAAPRTRASASRPTRTACSARGWSRPTRLPIPAPWTSSSASTASGASMPIPAR